MDRSYAWKQVPGITLLSSTLCLKMYFKFASVPVAYRGHNTYSLEKTPRNADLTRSIQKCVQKAQLNTGSVFFQGVVLDCEIKWTMKQIYYTKVIFVLTVK